MLLVVGLSGSFYLDIWAHIQLLKFKIFWEMNVKSEVNLENELRRSEAQDL
jgi:hypothetical protein